MPYDDFATWLHTRAALLTWLEHQHYPAPRLIRTRQGQAIVMHQGWGILMTTFIEGTTAAPEPHTVELLGAALGQLHVLPAPRLTPPKLLVSHSWWNQHQAIAAAVERLARLAQIAPSQWQELLAALRTTLCTLEHAADLPHGVIHADCWIGNAIRSAEGDMVLIDWEFAGVGPLILDLAGLLSNCHLDLPSAQPSQERISAIMPATGRIGRSLRSR
jgi:Ser/Thr protein kinase RdoA (MazF antagonist)